ncbi:MAG: type IV secretion system protein, partial [Rickettsiales bacterium]|nr:type IV secretion system protein [Rickettsiales bacterium]
MENVKTGFLCIARQSVRVFWKKFLRKVIIVFLIFNMNFWSSNSIFFDGNIARADDLDKVKNIFENIPVFGPLISTVEFFVKLGKGLKGSDSMTILTSILSAVFDPMGQENLPTKKAFQQVFKTNQYCYDQAMYREEQKYISKQGGGRPNTGFAFFPVYPMKINVANNLCNMEGQIGDYKSTAFIKNEYPINSKCSYTYTSEYKSCFMEGTLPLIVLDLGTQLIAKIIYAAVCANVSTGLTIFSITMLVLSTAMGIFGANLAMDPYTYLGTSKISTSIDFIISCVPAIIMYLIPPWAYLHCIFIALLAYFVHIIAMQVALSVWEAIKYSQGKKALMSVRFCGYDWFSYNRKTYNFDSTSTTLEDGSTEINGHTFTSEEKKIVPVKGMYNNSRFKTIVKCIEGATAASCADPNTGNPMTISSEFCTDSANIDCTNIKAYSRDVRNRNYREYLYQGKEYIMKSGNNWYLPIEFFRDATDNRSLQFNYSYKDCIDPRLPIDKGVDDMAQAYYYRGNDMANYACGRFFYDGASGCILHRDLITSGSDISKLTRATVADYYLLDPTSEVFEKYSDKCTEMFKKARDCCRSRSRNFACLEEKEKKEEHKGTFCFSNVIYDNTAVNEKQNMLTYLMDADSDQTKAVCNIKGGEFEVSKKYNTDRACVFSTNFCPFNFRLNMGINYMASFCDSNSLEIISEGEKVGLMPRGETYLSKTRCTEGFFSDKAKSDYLELAEKFGINSGTEKYNEYVFGLVKSDMDKFNSTDYELIYNFGKAGPAGSEDYTKCELLPGCECENGGQKCDTTRKEQNEKGNVALRLNDFWNYSNGNLYKLKNFCQYAAHCVMVESDDMADEVFDYDTLFFDTSCSTGKSENSRFGSYPEFTSNSFTGSRQLTSPVVECIFESMNNLIRGVSATSLCASGSGANTDGYCGSHTAEDVASAVKYSNKLELEKYKFVENLNGEGGKYIIKGYALPDSYNPFLKLKNALIGTLRVLFCLFLVLFAFRLLIKGRSLMSDLKPSEFTLKALQFAAVMWLCIGSGVQDVLADKAIQFSLGVYEIMAGMLEAAVPNQHNHILEQNLDKMLDLQQDFSATGSAATTYYPCFMTRMTGEVVYAPVKADGTCDSPYTLASSIRVFTKEGNVTSPVANQLVIRGNQALSALFYFMDTENEGKSRGSGTLALYGKSDNGSVSLADEIDGGSNNFGLWNKDYSGCYFDPAEYPRGKSYLAIFDSLDCKFSLYIGSTSGSMLSNLFMYAGMLLFVRKMSEYEIPVLSKAIELVGMVMGFLGQVLFMLMFTFFFALLSICIKIMYNFLSATITLSILIFCTPMCLPFILFDKTKRIADTWIQTIISMAISPTLNIAIAMTFFNVLDMFLLGGLAVTTSVTGSVKTVTTTRHVLFNGHNEFGREPVMTCVDDYSTLICFFKAKVPVFSQIIALFESGNPFYMILTIIVSLAIIKCGDEAIEGVREFVQELIAFGSDDTKLLKSSPSETSGGWNISDSIESGKKFGKGFVDIAERASHLPGAMLSKAREAIERNVETQSEKEKLTKTQSLNKDIAASEGSIHALERRNASADITEDERQQNLEM